MSANPIDAVLARLPGAKPTGTDRWRCVCPAHGGTNRSTLSIGVADSGAVLLRCWSGCSIESIVQALGLEVGGLFPPRPERAGSGTSPQRRRRMLSAQQALDLLESEMHLLQVCSADMAAGVALDEATRERLLLAGARLYLLRDEVAA